MQELRDGCPPKAEWSDFLQGTVNDRTFTTLSEHLTSCEKCAVLLDGLSSAGPGPVQFKVPSPFLDEENLNRIARKLRNLVAQQASMPVEEFERIDHFQVQRQIGQGGFGKVLLARDTKMNRDVVIKIPRQKHSMDLSSINVFLEEARKLAQLNHPNIVSIYHIGEWAGQPYLVQQYVSGGDLSRAFRTRQFSFSETALLISEVADGIAYAHKFRIVHRDLKPANILLEHPSGRALVADFGLAIHESRQLKAVGSVAGTLQYMSPEQILGESHRLDGRSDIWSIGVILYRMLVNDLPFQTEDVADLRIQICKQPPRPLRQLDATIPSELERICMKCLSVRMNDRYSTAQDLADELRDWLKTSLSPAQQTDNGKSMSFNLRNSHDGNAATPVIPKGLFAFNEGDQSFFLDLLPGPRTREGVPEQIRFWKDKILAKERRQSFAVGLIYGPSGCGKSSFIQAGLIPQLPEQVLAIYTEATDADTELGLINGLRKKIPQIPSDLDLVEILNQLRDGYWLKANQKVLLVVDQFEQWLQSNEIGIDSPLIKALRQCDSIHLHAIVLARDDFWMKVSRFFQELEIELSESENFHPLYLFDASHAKKVLTMFGQAYGKLASDRVITAGQEKFLDEAVRRLIDRDKIICIRLVLLIETLKFKDWTLDALKEIGQIQSIGTLFLEENLSGDSTNPNMRFYRDGICAVLRRLLPAEGTNIKARFRERSQLAQTSGFPEGSKQFDVIMDILEKQLRLIAPSDPESAVGHRPNEARYYQLTHDFLVPSVRDWLKLIDGETPAGRAKLRLESLAHSYEQSNDARFQPKLLEFISIARYVRPRQLDLPAQKLYWKSLRSHARRAAFAAVLLASVVFVWNENQLMGRRLLADTRAIQWMNAEEEAQLIALDLLTADASGARVALLSKEKKGKLNSTDQIRIDLGLALLGNVDDDRVHRLAGSVGSSSFVQLLLLRKAFEKVTSKTVPLLEANFSSEKRVDARIKIAMLLFHLGKPQSLEKCLNDRSDAFEFEFATQFISQDADSAIDYIRYLESNAIRNVKHDDDLSGIVMALAKRNLESLDTASVNSWHRFVGDLYHNSPSAPMHSAAEFAVAKLNQSLNIPQKISDNWNNGHAEDAPKLPNDKNWFVAPNELTFVRINAAGKTLSKTVQAWQNGPLIEMESLGNFWMSTSEVSGKLFFKFAQSRDAEKLFDQSWKIEDPAIPATRIRIGTVMAFCNWLSKREGLAPFYIELETETEFQDSEVGLQTNTSSENQRKVFPPWLVNKGASGYRLPHIAELYWAAQGMRHSSFSPRGGDRFPTIGDVRNLVLANAWFDENSVHEKLVELQPCKKLLPNFHGLFDIHGNASELSVALHSAKIEEEQFALGSYFASSLEQIVFPQVNIYFPWNVRQQLGFRLVLEGNP